MPSLGGSKSHQIPRCTPCISNLDKCTCQQCFHLIKDSCQGYLKDTRYSVSLRPDYLQSDFPAVNLDGAALMLRHLRHACVLSTLLLCLKILIVHLLLITVVAGIDLAWAAWHACLLWRKGANIFGRFGNIGSLDTVVGCWFWSIQTGLQGSVSRCACTVITCVLT